MMIMISIANGLLIWCFMYAVALSALNQDHTNALIIAQQFLAKEQGRNKCLVVSTRCLKHNSQE
jgi:hypothetical protein